MLLHCFTYTMMSPAHFNTPDIEYVLFVLQDTLDAEPVEPKNYDEHCPYKYVPSQSLVFICLCASFLIMLQS